MRNLADDLNEPALRDRGTAGFLFWIVLYALFLVALMAIGGGSHVFTVHSQYQPPAAGSGMV